jgi:hypothetical protein
MTIDERKIMEILVSCLPTPDAWGGPIEEARLTMPGWDSATAKRFVEDMVRRGLLQIKSNAKEHNDSEDKEESWWELGDVIVASYKGIAIELSPVELQEGGWKADFTLTEHTGSEVRPTFYYGTATYATREMAKLAALDSAWAIIDEEY